MRGTTLIATATLVAVIAAGCQSAAPTTAPVPTEAALATPTPSPSATPTDAPTLSPTPSPTPRPTPTPAPTISATKVAQIAFASHVVNQLGLILENTDDIVAYIQAGDTASTRRAVTRGLEMLEAELEYLRNNPPAACFADAHAQWRRAVTKYSDAYAAIDYGLRPPVTMRDVERGIELLAEGTTILTGTSKTLAASEC